MRLSHDFRGLYMLDISRASQAVSPTAASFPHFHFGCGTLPPGGSPRPPTLGLFCSPSVGLRRPPGSPPSSQTLRSCDEGHDKGHDRDTTRIVTKSVTNIVTKSVTNIATKVSNNAAGSSCRIKPTNVETPAPIPDWLGGGKGIPGGQSPSKAAACRRAASVCPPIIRASSVTCPARSRR